MIEFKDGRYFSCLWFVPGKVMDFMGALWRDEGSSMWQAAYRFRYYVDEKVHDSEDKKSWYTLRFHAHVNEREAVASIDHVLDLILPTFPEGMGGVEKVLIKSDRAEACLEALAREKWAHVKMLDAAPK